MTITPTAPAPAVLPAGGQDPAGSTDPSAPGAFVALVQQALAEALGGAPATPGATADQGGDPAPAPSEHAAVDPALTAAATGLAAVVPPALPAPVTVTAAAPALDAVASSGDPTGTSTGVPAVVPDGTVAAAGSAASGDGAGRRTGTPARDSATAVRPASPDTVRDAAADPAGTTGQATAQGPAQGPAQGSSQAPAPASAPSPLPPGLTPVVAAAAPAGAPATPATTQQVTQQVTGQVFPEVTSLVTRGDGTHRITLTLKPEALGEVRVVMTVRDGAVHVRLAAGHDAQQALLQGSPELTRLLEHAGATDTRIVVRDLLAAAAPTTGSADPGPDLGQGLGAGGHRPQDEHAGTRAQQQAQHQVQATDGRQDSTTTGANPPRSNQSVTSSRAAGVDVTM